MPNSSVSLSDMRTMSESWLTRLRISNLDGKMPMISLVPHIQALDMSNNKLNDKNLLELCKVLPLLENLRELNLADNNISSSGMEGLSDALSKLPKLQKINLLYNNFSDSGLKRLCDVLPNLSELKELNISDNRISDDGIGSLASILPQLPNLYHLGLTENLLSQKGITLFCESLPHLKKLTNLWISFRDDVGPKDDPTKKCKWTLHVSSSITENLEAATSITPLASSNVEVSAETSSGSTEQTPLNSVKVYHPSYCLFSDGCDCSLAGLLRVLVEFGDLASVDLSESLICLDKYKMERMCMPIRNIIQIKQLVMKELDDDSMADLCNVLPSLSAIEHLVLSGSQLTDTGISGLCKVLPLCTSLKILDLQRSCISECGMSELCKLAQNLTTLTKFVASYVVNCEDPCYWFLDFESVRQHLSVVKIAAIFGGFRAMLIGYHENCLDDEAMKSLCRILTLFVKHLEVVDFAGRNLKMSEHSLSLLFETLSSLRVVKTVTLADNELGDNQSRVISELLPNFFHLTELDLSGNCLSDKGVVCIFKVLEQLKRLRRLGVSFSVHGGQVKKTEPTKYQQVWLTMCHSEDHSDININTNSASPHIMPPLSQSPKLRVKHSCEIVDTATMVAFCRVLMELKLLKVLDLASNSWNKQSLKAICSVLPKLPCLCELVLSSSTVVHNKMNVLTNVSSKLLTGYSKKIIVINNSCSDEDEDRLLREVITALSQEDKKNNIVWSIQDVSDHLCTSVAPYYVHEEGEQWINNLCMLISQFPKLGQLKLSNHVLSNIAAGKLITVLPHLGRLRELDLSFTQASVDAVKAICKTLKELKTFRMLDISYNDLGDSDIELHMELYTRARYRIADFGYSDICDRQKTHFQRRN